MNICLNLTSNPVTTMWTSTLSVTLMMGGIVAVRGKDRAISESVLSDLENTGWLCYQYRKKPMGSSHTIEWLGFVIDLSKSEFSVPDSKISKLKCKQSQPGHMNLSCTCSTLESSQLPISSQRSLQRIGLDPLYFWISLAISPSVGESNIGWLATYPSKTSGEEGATHN